MQIDINASPLCKSGEQGGAVKDIHRDRGTGIVR